MRDQQGAGNLQFWPQRPTDSYRLPGIHDTDTPAARISTVDSSAEAVTLYTTPLRRRPRNWSRASSPFRSLRGKKVDPAVTAPAGFLPAVERSSPSAGLREGTDHGGIAHEPILGSFQGVDSDAPDIFWAKRDETGTILRLDMAAWHKRDHEVAESLAALRKDVFIETSVSCRQQARLWRARKKQMRDGSEPFLGSVDLKQPRAFYSHRMPKGRPRLAPHCLEQKVSEDVMSDQSGDEVVESFKHAAESRKGTLVAKWAAQRARTKCINYQQKEERLHQQQAQGERRAKQKEQLKRRELEEQRDKRERLLQRQRAQLDKKGDIYGHGHKPESHEHQPETHILSKDSHLPRCHEKTSELLMGTTYRVAQESEPKMAQAEEQEEVAKAQDVQAADVAKVQDATETCRDDDEESSSNDDEDEDSKQGVESSENEDAEEDFTRQQQRLAEQQPNTRLTRFEKRVTQLHREERKRTKQLQKEEQELLELDAEQQEQEAALNPSTSFDTCMNVAEMYKVPLKVVQQAFKDFNELDADSNGSLSLDEFEAAIRKTTEVGPDEDLPDYLILKSWESIDNNKDSRVDFNEYFLWTLQAGWKEEILVNDPKERQLRELARDFGVTVLDVERLKRVFDKFDVDKSGEIDKDEFVSVICSLMNAVDTSQVSHSMLNRYWKEADRNNDGGLDLPEFMVWYYNHFAT